MMDFHIFVKPNRPFSLTFRPLWTVCQQCGHFKPKIFWKVNLKTIKIWTPAQCSCSLVFDHIWFQHFDYITNWIDQWLMHFYRCREWIWYATRSDGVSIYWLCVVRFLGGSWRFESPFFLMSKTNFSFTASHLWFLFTAAMGYRVGLAITQSLSFAIILQIAVLSSKSINITMSDPKRWFY